MNERLIPTPNALETEIKSRPYLSWLIDQLVERHRKKPESSLWQAIWHLRMGMWYLGRLEGNLSPTPNRDRQPNEEKLNAQPRHPSQPA